VEKASREGANHRSASLRWEQFLFEKPYVRDVLFHNAADPNKRLTAKKEQGYGVTQMQEFTRTRLPIFTIGQAQSRPGVVST